MTPPESFRTPNDSRWVKLGSLLREPLRNGHSAKVTTRASSIRSFSIRAVTQGDFSEKNIKITNADPARVRDLWLEPAAQISGTSNDLRSVWGTDASNVWAVGDDTMVHWNGTAWAAETIGNSVSLYSVWGTDASNVWAVGWGGMILHKTR